MMYNVLCTPDSFFNLVILKFRIHCLTNNKLNVHVITVTVMIIIRYMDIFKYIVKVLVKTIINFLTFK